MTDRIYALVDAIAKADSPDVRHELGLQLLAEVKAGEQWMKENNNVVVIDSGVVVLCALASMLVMTLIGYLLSQV